MHIQAFGSYSERIDTTQILPDLRPAISELGIPRFRRIDRFTQLCLLGSGLCAQHYSGDSGRELGTEASIIICSQMAGISSTVQAHEQIFRHRQAPKPANFINTLSNSAGFYVAKHLEVKGQNHFLTRSGGAFEAGLELMNQVQADILLLGHIEECSLPLSLHRQRLGLASNSPVCEHSHWFLLTAQQSNNSLASMTDFQRTNSTQLLTEKLTEKNGEVTRYLTGKAQLSLPLLCSEIETADNTSHALALFLQSADTQTLQCISQDDSGFYYLLEFSRNGEG